MAKLKFKDEYDNFIPVVQDVKVNGNSVFDGKDADIKLKTINNESIVGTGNINISGTATDVQVNGTSITSNNVANIVTETAYNETTNKIATVADLPDISTKQDTLVSGTNIKTINSQSILGSGDITIDSLPSQAGNNGKFLTTNGTNASWATASKVTMRVW